MQKEQAKQRYIGFGLSLLSANADKLVLGCNDCGDMSKSKSELFGTNWNQSEGHDGSTLTQTSKIYLPCADGNYRVTISADIGGTAHTREFTIDAEGNCTSEQLPNQ